MFSRRTVSPHDPVRCTKGGRHKKRWLTYRGKKHAFCAKCNAPLP